MPTDPYVLAVFADGAVLLDLRSGSFFRLNPSAARICEGLLNGQTGEAIAHDRAAVLKLDPAVARREVEAVQIQLDAKPPATSRNPIVFEEDGEGLVLCWKGQPIWHLDPNGRRLRYLPDPRPAADLQTQLLWVAPHLLRLRNRLVLHASAVAYDGTVQAFCAGSGHGKTTLACRLAAHGPELIAEDLLILDRGFHAVIDGEPMLRAWVEKQIGNLRSSVEVSTDDLDRVEGPRLPLGQILFIQRDSTESEIATHPLGPTDAMLLLLENSFAEVARPELWRQLWEENCKLVATVPMFRAAVPEGLDRLETAVGCYVSNWKSRDR